MVNTFLVDSNFSFSAQQLDRQRLGKQRVEALQILCLCQDLRRIGKHYNEKIPKAGVYQWIRQIVKRYKVDDISLVQHQNGEGKKKYIVYDKKVIEQVPRIRKSSFDIDGFTFQPKDRVVTLGFVYHPAVQMWLGYEKSLMLYIDKHIEEWVRRGYQNTMSRYPLTNVSKIKHPTWVMDSSLHRNHKASLLAKEITRKEKPWYINKEDFVAAGTFVDYHWPIDKNPCPRT